MGYRSNVTVLLYSEEKEFPMLKLWIDENLMPAINEHWGEEDYCPHEFKRGTTKGYAFTFDDVKWYDNYPDVQAIEQAWALFDETFNEGMEVTFAGEYVRIGEQTDDIEERCTYHHQNLLQVVRCAEF